MLRKGARNEFEKDFFKLMNNSVFGKMIENVRKRRDIKSIVTEETSVLMDKPILLGQTILDKSKELMYEFWY